MRDIMAWWSGLMWCCEGVINPCRFLLKMACANS